MRPRADGDIAWPIYTEISVKYDTWVIHVTILFDFDFHFHYLTIFCVLCSVKSETLSIPTQHFPPSACQFRYGWLWLSILVDFVKAYTVLIWCLKHYIYYTIKIYRYNLKYKLTSVFECLFSLSVFTMPLSLHLNI